MSGETNAWTENVNSLMLHSLLGSFSIKMPDYHDRWSFAAELLGTTELTQFIGEIKLLAKRVVLYNNLRIEDKKPGTVYILEVVVRKKDHKEFLEKVYVFFICLRRYGFSFVLLFPTIICLLFKFHAFFTFCML